MNGTSLLLNMPVQKRNHRNTYAWGNKYQDYGHASLY